MSRQQIHNEVEKLLHEGSARGISHWLTYKNTGVCLAFIEIAGVVEKLVELTVLAPRRAGEGNEAFNALGDFVTVPQVAQDAIARAHDGAIFVWLADEECRRHDYMSERFRTNLTKNHPTNTRLLAAARAGGASLVRVTIASMHGGGASLGELSSFFFTAAVAMSELISSHTTDTLSSQSVSALAQLVKTEAHCMDSSYSAIYDQVVLFLVKRMPDERVQLVLTASPLGLVDHLHVLKNAASNVRSKLLAVIRLAEAASDESIAIEIVSCGGVPVLVSSLLCSDDGTVCFDELFTKSVHFLEGLPRRSCRVREAIMRTDGLAHIVLLYRSQNASHMAVALTALHPFLHDPRQALVFGNAWGIPFLIELLLEDEHFESPPETLMVQILTTLLVGYEDATNEANQQAVVDCDGGIALLVRILSIASTPTNDVAEFTKKATALVPLLVSRIQNDDATMKHDTLGVVLNALEIFSRIRDNQSLFQHTGIQRFVDLLGESKDDHVKIRCASILANISHGNDGMSILLVDCGCLEPLASMVKSPRTTFQTAALLALRNVACNDENRAKVGSLGLIPLVVKLAAAGQTMEQKEASVALLGTLSTLRANREQVVAHGGIAALLSFLREASSSHQVETAAAALWTMVEAQKIGHLLDIGGLVVLQKATSGHPPGELGWASRLQQRLVSAAMS